MQSKYHTECIAEVSSHAWMLQGGWRCIGGDVIAYGISASITVAAGLGGDMPFKYWTYGAAATEVELDVLIDPH